MVSSSTKPKLLKNYLVSTWGLFLLAEPLLRVIQLGSVLIVFPLQFGSRVTDVNLQMSPAKERNFSSIIPQCNTELFQI